MAMPGKAPHTPTASQLSQLKTLQTARDTAAATLASAQTSLASAQAAYQQATVAFKKYEGYVYGNTRKSNIVDEGTQDAV